MNGLMSIVNLKSIAIASLFSFLVACGSEDENDLDLESKDLDLTPPVIEINGDSVINLKQGDEYSELGAFAIDDIDGAVEVIVTGAVNTNVIGQYIITYTAKDNEGNVSFIDRTIIVSEQDSIPPVITLNGGGVYAQNEDMPYTEPGYNVSDNSDEPVEVDVAGTVDVSSPGQYELTYTATDVSGNTSSVTRLVIVLDITSPVITLNGSNPHIQSEDTIYKDAGATALDNVNGRLSVKVIGSVDYHTPGTYSIKYVAEDASGNLAAATRSVTITDNTAPLISLQGENPYVQNEGEPYNEPGYIATDNSNGPVNVQVKGLVDVTTPGNYSLTYVATDSEGNISEISRTIIIKDLTGPVITVKGENPHFQREDTLYEDAGATAQDNMDGSLGVKVYGEVDVFTPGSYTITYVAEDASGNESRASRTVIVSDITPPEISLKGSNPHVQDEDTPYLESGYTTKDNSGNPVVVTRLGEMNTNNPGSYELTYIAKDQSGNTSQVVRTVLVNDITPPVITLIGDESLSIPHKGEYVEAGATATDNLDGLVQVSTTGYVDTFNIGEYKITYTAKDIALNTHSITRTVTVTDVTPPIIHLNGSEEIILKQGSEFNDPVTATDDHDSVVSVTITGNVDFNKAGEYTLNYTAKDSAGNQSTALRKIIVRKSNPFITTWKTDNGDGQNKTKITINTRHSMSSYNVDWGDGTEDLGVSGSVSHDYSLPGIYKISIDGDFKSLAHFEDSREKIISIDQWGDIEWETMREAFQGCKNLKINAEDSPDLTNVTDMSFMFSGAENINRDLSHWDVSSVKDMSFLFAGASSFNGDISQWDVSSVNNMKAMFFKAKSFNSQIDEWNVSAVTNMESMFEEAAAFNKDISNWDVSSVAYMPSIFREAKMFNGDIGRWDVSSNNNFNSMFEGATNFNKDIGQWDVSSARTMSRMFYGAKIFNQDIGMWDVSSVYSMGSMFYEAFSFNSDIGDWDVSNVIEMFYMFYRARRFNQDLNRWDVSSSQNMSYMFACEFDDQCDFNGDISDWDVSSVGSTKSMFMNTKKFKGNLSQWDVSSVRDMSSMFQNTFYFNSDLSMWDVSSVWWMDRMFEWNVEFNSDLSQWDVSSVKSMSYMFNYAKMFNSDISLWDVSSVDDIAYMFEGAKSFDQDLGKWDVDRVRRFDDMLKGVTLSVENYDSLLIGWGNQYVMDRMVFNAGKSEFSNAARSARDVLIGKGWTIKDGGWAGH